MSDDWVRWCEEREIRQTAMRSALRRSDLTFAQIKQQYRLIKCAHCGERHR